MAEEGTGGGCVWGGTAFSGDVTLDRNLTEVREHHSVNTQRDSSVKGPEPHVASRADGDVRDGTTASDVATQQSQS